MKTLEKCGLHFEKYILLSLRQTMAVLVSQQCIVQMSPRHAQLDSSQGNMLATPYTELFLFQTCSSQVKLYEVWLYAALK